MSHYPDNTAPTRAYFEELRDCARGRRAIADDLEAGDYARRIADLLADAESFARAAQRNGDLNVPPQAGADRAERQAAEIAYTVAVIREALEDRLTPDAVRRLATYEEAFPHG